MESSFRVPNENLSPRRFRIRDLFVLGLRIEMAPDGHGGTRCFLEGALNGHSAPQLKRLAHELLSHAPRTLVIDLRGVVKMDANGLAALAEVSAWGHQAKCRVLLLNLPPRVRRTIMRASLHQILEVADSDF